MIDENRNPDICPTCSAYKYEEFGAHLGSRALDCLASCYQQWLGDHGLPQVSMEDHDMSLLKRDEAVTLSHFILLWGKLEQEVEQ
jgi:hypothetical protein